MAPKVSRWPDHWYSDQVHIRCVVPDCEFTTPSPNAGLQWDEIHDHCTNTPGAEHEILEKMLQQTMCAIDNCNHPPFMSSQSYKSRALFTHEKVAHESTDMSNICSFVRLAREGRVRSGLYKTAEPNCERLAFHRMLDKVQALPHSTISLLFQMSGFRHPDEQTRENMGRILTADHLAEEGEERPDWWPIRAEHFLWLIRPNFNDPSHLPWSTVWVWLRDEYANGRI